LSNRCKIKNEEIKEQEQQDNEINDEFKIEKKRKKFRVGRIILVIFLLMLIALVVAGVIFMKKVNDNGGGAAGIVSAVVGAEVSEEKLANMPKIYCVLLGQSQNLTDTIMLASYDPKKQEAALLTIPRDTFVGDDISTASPWYKINALCQYDHPEKTVEAVSKITGIEVTNYCLIDTKALVEVVDLIGGVYFDVPIKMKYTDKKQGLYINLKPGYQLLDGKAAEGLVRFRHNQDGTTYPEEYGREDIGRSRTQREFLMGLAKQMLQPQNILKIGGFLDIFYDNVKTNMNISDIKDYLPYAVDFNTKNISTGIIPGENKLCNGYYMYLHDEEGTAEIVQELFGDKSIEDEDSSISSDANIDSTEIVDKNINIELLNGTDNENALYNVKNKLEANGYTVTKTTETNLTKKTTIINRTNVSEEEVEDLQKLMGTGTISSANKSGKIDITIIIGSDY